MCTQVDQDHVCLFFTVKLKIFIYCCICIQRIFILCPQIMGRIFPHSSLFHLIYCFTVSFFIIDSTTSKRHVLTFYGKEFRITDKTDHGNMISFQCCLFSGIQINRLNASVPDIPGSIINPADCQSISVRRNCDGSYMIHCIHSQSDLFHAVLVQVIPIHINSIQRLAAKYKHSIMKCPDRSFQHVVLFF